MWRNKSEMLTVLWPQADADVIPGLMHTLSAAKRKNTVLDFGEATVVVEKRPKYERKSWVRGRQLC